MPIPLRDFIAANRNFFICYLLFVVLGGVALLVFEHGDWILFFSEHRNFWVDSFFRYWTRMGEEPAYIGAIILLLLINVRYAIFLPFIGIVVTVVATLLKTWFAQPRPGLYYQNNGLIGTINAIEGVILHVGNTSFPSGHTMSGFALYSFIAFCLPRKTIVPVLLFTAAVLVGLSRIVLVQHFLRDVYVGGVVGVLLAVVTFYLQQFLSNNPQKWWNQRLFGRRAA